MGDVKIAVTGGRDFEPTSAELDRFWELWYGLALEGRPVLLHGDSRGVDRAVAAAVRRKGFEVIAFPANWDRHGKAAGPLRNEQMMKQAEALIAFPGGRGTAHCTSIARQAGKSVYLIPKTEAPGTPPAAAPRVRK